MSPAAIATTGANVSSSVTPARRPALGWSRPSVAGWYTMAAYGLAGPRRAISSARWRQVRSRTRRGGRRGAGPPGAPCEALADVGRVAATGLDVIDVRGPREES